MSTVQQTALFVTELVIVAVFGLSCLAVGVYVSWWGSLGMFLMFVLGGVFRDIYNLRIGRFR